MELIRQGKVRDVYADGDDLILVASDRVSVYDVVLPTPIPDKGTILTQLSLWWFGQVADLVPNHVLSEDVPPEWKGRAIRCRQLDMVPVECIARGYLAGLGLESYRATGSISGIRVPPGLAEADRLPEAIFTPTTKAERGRHDEFMTLEEVRDLVGEATADDLERLTLAVYTRGAEIAQNTSLAGRSGRTTSNISGTGRPPWVIGGARLQGRRFLRRWWRRPGLAMWRSTNS